MGAERDANLHQPVGKLEQIRDANLPSLPFPLLFPHGELGWHLAVRYQDGTTSDNNNRISCRNLPHSGSGSSPVGIHRSIVLQDYFCAQFPHGVMRMPSLPVSHGASKLLLLLLILLLLLLLLLPAHYSHKYCSNKPHMKMILIAVIVIQKEKFVIDGRRLWMVIHGQPSSNLWSLECLQLLGTQFSLCFYGYKRAGRARVALVCNR